MSVAYRSTCRPTIGQPLSVDTSTGTRPICRLICQPTSDQYIGRYVYQHIGHVAVDISTYRPIYRSICRPIYRPRGAQITQDPRKLGHFFKNVNWRSLLIKRVMLERYSILGDFFFRLKLLSIIFSLQSRLSKSCFLIGHLNWQDGPILSTQDFQCLSHKRKFSFWWEYKMFQSRWLDIVFLDHYTFLEG